MAGRRQLPPVDELVRMRRKGMTHRQIAEWWFEQSGEKVTTGAISVALSRAGHTEPHRHEDLIPWRVAMPHQKNFHLRMLRAEARMREGGEVDPAMRKRVEEWKNELREVDAVIHYNRDRGGFKVVTRRPGIDTDLIRVACPKCKTEPIEKCRHDASRVRAAS